MSNSWAAVASAPPSCAWCRKVQAVGIRLRRWWRLSWSPVSCSAFISDLPCGAALSGLLEVTTSPPPLPLRASSRSRFGFAAGCSTPRFRKKLCHNPHSDSLLRVERGRLPRATPRPADRRRRTTPLPIRRIVVFRALLNLFGKSLVRSVKDSRPARRKPRRARLGLDHLETRELLSGNTAGYVLDPGGNLFQQTG